MKIVDLSHTMSIHTPGWVGYAGNKMYYAQNLQTAEIVAQRIETRCMSARISTAPCTRPTAARRHGVLPLDFLVNRGVVVDISKHMHDWAVITPEIIEVLGRRHPRRRYPHPAHRLA